MQNEKSFVILGEPCGKGRPRFSTKTGRTYTPQKTQNYENLVKMQYALDFGVDRFSDKAMLGMSIMAYYGIPKSASKKKQEDMRLGVIRPTKKPDMDNVVKIIADSLNGVAYHDDTQIVDCLCRKFYSDNPRVVVKIREVASCANRYHLKYDSEEEINDEESRRAHLEW